MSAILITMLTVKSNKLPCVAFCFDVCHASECFVYAIRLSTKLPDWNVPEANEHQQIESSVNHLIFMEMDLWISQELHTQAYN